jgi:hypothetical protein
MSFLSRLFGPKPVSSPAGSQTEERLRALENEAERARPGYRGTALNKAGDLALKGDLKSRAVAYYGRAIDAFLEDGQREAARGVANKIIRVHPKAVRTLCTLTWLDLAARHTATAMLHLRDYVVAAKDIGESEIAAEQIYKMARFAFQPEFLGAAADALDMLDLEARAAEVREWSARNGSPVSATSPEELAEACLAAAIRSSKRKGDPAGDGGDG